VTTAYAHTNIALVKYWGKRSGLDRSLNLPDVGSLSLTLDRFGTETTVVLDEPPQAAAGAGGDQDVMVLDGAPARPEEAERVRGFLDLVRAAAGERRRASVTSRNDVPTAAGLASSASGFAALALAACAAYGVDIDARALSQLARRGSGSAARSVFGGLVVQHRGGRDDGADCFAEPLPSPLIDDDRVRLVVARTAVGRKGTDSTRGMERTAETSPYYGAWTSTHGADLREAIVAAEAGDLPKLGEVMEHNTLKMHASALAARPAVLYWNGATLEALHEVRRLRQGGTGAWATMDAGPHVKVLCATTDASFVAAALAAVPGVVGVETCAPGPAARLVDAAST
jgi:diphosphomevalonate decarboxylase